MEGITKQPFPYIPECDRDLPSDKQTTVWLRPIGGMDAPTIEANFARSEITKAGGVTDYNIPKRKEAYLKTLAMAICKVENFLFSEDEPGLREKGYWSFDDPFHLNAFFKQLTTTVMAELIEIASKGYALDSVEKKTRNSDVLPIVETGQLGSGEQELHVSKLSGGGSDKKKK